MSSTSDLNQAERYATAALFTLALHSTQVENWVPSFVDVKLAELRAGSSDAVTAAWGCSTRDSDFPFEELPLDTDTTLFWGWDSVRTRGLCQRVYRHLGIPEKQWPALLSLPEVAGYPSPDITLFVELVRTYVELLDNSVAVKRTETGGEWGHGDPTRLMAGEDAQASGSSLGSGGSSGAKAGHIEEKAADVVEGEKMPGLAAVVADGEGHAEFGDSQASAQDFLSRCFSVEPEATCAPESADAVPMEEPERVAKADRGDVPGAGCGAHAAQGEHIQTGAMDFSAPGPVAEGLEESPRRDLEDKAPEYEGISPQESPKESRPQLLGTGFSLSSDSVPDEEVVPQLQAAKEVSILAAMHGRQAPDVPGEDAEVEAAGGSLASVPDSPTGTVLAGGSLMDHLVEDFMPVLTPTPSNATTGSRSGANTPSSGAGGGSGIEKLTFGRLSSLFKPSFRLVGSSGDMEDINYELEKEIAEAKIQQELQEPARGEERNELDGEEASLPSLGLFEKHVHPGRTGIELLIANISKERESGLDASPEALGVVWELLTATLNIHDDDDINADPRDILGEALDHEAAAAAARAAVRNVRWYDARSRIAIKMVAAWLRVPWRRILNLEALLATTYMFPEAASTVKTRHWTSSRALKVGAAAIAGGGLLALTGGLAAPALAAGLGAAITMVGGTAVQAGAISGLASTAAVASTFGTYGSAVFGNSMINRTAQVSEFGFYSLDRDEDLEELEEGDADSGSDNESEATVDSAGSAEGADGADGDLASCKRGVNEEGSSPGSTSVVLEDDSEQLPEIAVIEAQPEIHQEPCRQSTGMPQSGAGNTPGSTSRWAWQGRWRSGSTGSLVPNVGTSGFSQQWQWKTMWNKAAAAISDATSPSAASSSSEPSTQEAGQQRKSHSEADLVSAEKSAVDKGSGTMKKKKGNKEDQPASSMWSLESWESWWRGRTPLPTLPAPVNLSPDRCRLAVTIAVNGWVQKLEDFVDPWDILDAADCERYAIVWESKRLMNLGGAMTKFVGAKVADQTAKWFIQHFFFTGVLAATSIPSLVVTSSAFIDNHWSVALSRAKRGGRTLANVLMSRAHGDRPVKLYGFSIGARLIFFCLLELYKNDCFGIVEEVVLLGTPVSIQERQWASARSVVAGRFVNGFSKRDWVLGVLYRTSNAFTKRCGGLYPVPVARIENVDLTSIVSGHTDYMGKMPAILEKLNLSTKSRNPRNLAGEQSSRQNQDEAAELDK